MTQYSTFTQKQHYIPQVYLRGFSSEYHRKDLQVSKYTIFCYDITGKNSFMKPIPIKTICYEKNLYEVKGNDGKYVFSNYLETFFSELERMFSVYRRELERKVFIPDNYKTRCFLSNKEKTFWLTYIVIQILRLPKILDLAERVSLEVFGEQISNEQAKNIARIFCLPFFEELEEHSKFITVFNALLESMKNMTFGVGVDKLARIITSDNPVFVFADDVTCKEYKRVIFPVTSEICLFLDRKEEKKNYPKNFLFPIVEEDLEEIFKSMTASSVERIFSNHLLKKKERGLIEEVLRERK